jgi:hypothetical protein
MPKFNITDPYTWSNASSKKQMSWKNNTIFDVDTGKNASELKMVGFIGELLGLIQGNTSKEKIAKYGVEKIIELIMDGLVIQRKDASNIVSVISEMINKETAPKLNFDILNTETWDKASIKQLVWQGQPLKMANGDPMTETEAVLFLADLIKFMGRKKELTKDYVIKVITNSLNKILQAEETPNETKASGNFDPRKTTTYQYADYNKPLVIDGISIYEYKRNEADNFIKSPKDEGNFASNVEFSLKHTPDYQLKNGEQTYLNDYIQWEVDRCNTSKKENIFGGYLFTDAMVELSADCTKEQREKIGKIMTDYRKGGMRTSRLKQLLYDEFTGVDNYSFTDVARAVDFLEEQELMASYYLDYNFDTDDEVSEFINASVYLKKYPRLKEYVIENLDIDE